MSARRFGPRKMAASLAYYRRRAANGDLAAADKAARLEQLLAAASACRCCGRPLTDPESVARGLGPDCHARLILSLETS